MTRHCTKGPNGGALLIECRLCPTANCVPFRAVQQALWFLGLTGAPRWATGAGPVEFKAIARFQATLGDVPITVSAFSAEDLAAHQITMAKDLQFATPNVTYSKTNFSGDDLTIRGIGNDVITGGGESGVSVSFGAHALPCVAATRISTTCSPYRAPRLSHITGTPPSPPRRLSNSS